MSTETENAIDQALERIHELREGDALKLLKDADAKAAGIASIGLTVLYEALVIIRSALRHSSPDDVRAALAAKAELAIQELAAIKFGGG